MTISKNLLVYWIFKNCHVYLWYETLNDYLNIVDLDTIIRSNEPIISHKLQIYTIYIHTFDDGYNTIGIQFIVGRKLKFGANQKGIITHNKKAIINLSH